MSEDAKVVNLAKRRAWERVRKMLKEGRIEFPARSAYYTPPEPKTDWGMAFAYMARSLSQPEKTE